MACTRDAELRTNDSQMQRFANAPLKRGDKPLSYDFETSRCVCDYHAINLVMAHTGSLVRDKSSVDDWKRRDFILGMLKATETNGPASEKTRESRRRISADVGSAGTGVAGNADVDIPPPSPQHTHKQDRAPFGPQPQVHSAIWRFSRSNDPAILRTLPLSTDQGPH